jgi:hypothetical protein
MGETGPRPLVLDAGALIAVERAKRRMTALLDVAFAEGAELAIPAGVVAQTWREGARQARIAKLLALDQVKIADLDREKAKAVGVLCGVTGVDDIVDVHVVLEARLRKASVVTSDPEDLKQVDAQIALIEV